MPETLKNTCTPGKKAVKSFSFNKIYSRELRSSSSGGLRSGSKFILQDFPSFPPLTPYCKSQAGIHQNDGDHNGSTGYQWWNMRIGVSDNLIIWIYSISICLAKYWTFFLPKAEVTCVLSSRIYSKKLLTSSALVPKKSGKMVLDFNPFLPLFG